MADCYLTHLRRFIHVRLAVKREIEAWKRGGLEGESPVGEIRTHG